MVRKNLWALIALIIVGGVLFVTATSCGGGGNVVKPVDEPIALTANDVDPDPGETTHRFRHVWIKPPTPELEYGMGVASESFEIPYGEWYYWTYDEVRGNVYHVVPFGEYHIPKGAIEVGFIANYGWVNRDDPPTRFTVVFFAEKDGIVDSIVDWKWTFVVDPSK